MYPTIPATKRKKSIATRAKYTLRFWEAIAASEAHTRRPRSPRSRCGVLWCSALGSPPDLSFPRVQSRKTLLTKSELPPTNAAISENVPKKRSKTYGRRAMPLEGCVALPPDMVGVSVEKKQLRPVGGSQNPPVGSRDLSSPWSVCLADAGNDQTSPSAQAAAGTPTRARRVVGCGFAAGWLCLRGASRPQRPGGRKGGCEKKHPRPITGVSEVATQPDTG